MAKIIKLKRDSVAEVLESLAEMDIQELIVVYVDSKGNVGSTWSAGNEYFKTMGAIEQLKFDMMIHKGE